MQKKASASADAPSGLVFKYFNEKKFLCLLLLIFVLILRCFFDDHFVPRITDSYSSDKT